MKIENWEIGTLEELPITNYQFLTVNCQLSTVNCQLSTINYFTAQINPKRINPLAYPRLINPRERAA
ncbi:MAG: hypothetical protein HC786_11305 [Richelia sp. CSU_2_1]|nr:hypothetical protein [Richelia sp. CSU_2_1]